MTYSQFVEELKELEENIEKDENEIDFTMLKMIQGILKEKEEKDKEQQLLQQEVDEMVNSILERPEDYFESKERNIEKMIQKSRARYAVPTSDKDREYTNNQATINTIVKLFDKIIASSTSTEIKFQLDDVRKQLKNINCKAEKAKVKDQIRKANVKVKLILAKEIEKENSKELT